MKDPVQYEADYQNFIANLPHYIPDGILEVNLELLGELGLLDEKHWGENSSEEEKFPHSFHVIEAGDKVTLYNEQFVIWIDPKLMNGDPITLTLICLIVENKPQLEMVFSTRGIYNTPKCILKVLKNLLEEVMDTQDVISSINNG